MLRFPHVLQHSIGYVFRRYSQLPADMVSDKFLYKFIIAVRSP